jgi:hypothetical protein
VSYLDGLLEPLPPAAVHHQLFNALLDWDRRERHEVKIYSRTLREISQDKGVIITVLYAAVKPGAFEERIRWHRAQVLKVA